MPELPPNPTPDDLIEHQVAMSRQADVWEDEIESLIAHGSFTEQTDELHSLAEFRDLLGSIIPRLRDHPEDLYETAAPEVAASVYALIDHLERLFRLADEGVELLQDELEH